MASIWDVQFPINFTLDGDETRDAVAKHINEISVMYDHLNELNDGAEKAENKGLPNGYAPLDRDMKIPGYYLPDNPEDVVGVIDGGHANTNFATTINGGGA
jgi:hypothetical protein